MTWLTGMITGLGNGFCLRGFSAIFKPLSAELGFSRAATSGAAGIRRFQTGLLAPVTGWLVDRFGPKWVIIVGICFLVGGLVFMVFINSLWTFYIVWGVIIGMGTTLGLTLGPDKALTDWFVSKRGRAFANRFVLIGTVSALVLPVITWIITTIGWRTSCLIWAGIMSASLPFIFFILKQKRPEYYGLLPDGADVGPELESGVQASLDNGVAYAAKFHETEYTLKEALRIPAFWILILADACLMIVIGGFNLHCIPFLTDMGIDPTVAGGMMAMMIFFTIPSSLLGGLVADRVRKEHINFLIAGASLCQAFGITVFLLDQTIASVYVLLVFFGFGTGPTRPLLILIRGRYFGRKAYGSIAGTSLMLGTPVGILAPVYAGWVYDTTGSYMNAFTLFAALAVSVTLMMCLVRPPKQKGGRA